MSNKTVLITGATAGIGEQTAQHLLQLGWQVTFTGRNSEKIAATTQKLAQYAPHPEQVKGMLCDNANFDHIQTLAASLQQAGTQLDGLVLNAGVFYPQTFGEVQPEDINTTMAINFTGPALMLQALLPVLKNPASIVYVSSIVVDKAFPTASVYAASKGAFEAFAHTLNQELARRGIRINYLRPGVTHTEIQHKAGMDEQQISGLSEAMKATPAGRILTPNDMVEAMAFMLSNGSLGMRGEHITIDGGYCL